MSLLARLVLAIGLAAWARGADPANAVPGQALVQLAPDIAWDSVARDCDLPPRGMQRRFPALERRCGGTCLLLHADLDTAELVARLERHPGVHQAAPNHLRSRSGVVVPEDPAFGNQWALEDGNGADADVSFLEAMRLVRADTSRPIVAVMDTGVDYRHPDLAPNLWVNPLEVPGNRIDDDNNGYVDDVHGADPAGDLGEEPDGDPMDAGLTVAHGTHVAGIVAAANGNGLGISGAYPAARILALKASPDGENFTAAAVVGGLDYLLDLVDRGEPVVAMNASFGGPTFNPVELAAYRAAAEAGILVTAAAGNDGRDNDTFPVYPADYDSPNIVSVAATTSSGRLAGFSNRGASSVDIAAPGQAIYATRPTHLDSLATVSWPDREVTGRGLIYAGLTPPGGRSGNLVDCRLGYPDEFPPAVNGHIALIDRGEILFSEKVANAAAAGAVACIIVNQEPGLFNGRLVQPSGLNLPAVGAALEDRAALRTRIGQTVTVVNAFNEEEGYEYLSGTSMAAPCVAAAAALAADHYPRDSVAERIQRILAAADPAPELAGRVAGSRRLNLRRILDGDAGGAGDDLPDWWELEQAGDLDRLDPAGDRDGDGWSDRAEFLAGTAPLDPTSWLRLEIGPDRVLHWPSLPGRQFQVEAGPNLSTGFQAVTGVLEATPPRNRQPVSGLPAMRFFRLNLLD